MPACRGMEVYYDSIIIIIMSKSFITLSTFCPLFVHFLSTFCPLLSFCHFLSHLYFILYTFCILFVRFCSFLCPLFVHFHPFFVAFLATFCPFFVQPPGYFTLFAPRRGQCPPLASPRGAFSNQGGGHA